MNVINKLQNTLNKLLINENDVKIIELSNELLETTKIIENCTSCKDKKIYGTWGTKVIKMTVKKINMIY